MCEGWSSLLDQGGTPGQVVQAISTSIVYRTLVVNNLYQQYLKRAPEPGGLSSSLAFLQAGGTD